MRLVACFGIRMGWFSEDGWEGEGVGEKKLVIKGLRHYYDYGERKKSKFRARWVDNNALPSRGQKTE